jgi:hypothetical protein
MCVSYFFTAFVQNILHANKYWALFSMLSYRCTQNVGLLVKCPLLVFDFNQNCNVSTNSGKTSQCQTSWKSIQKFWVVTSKQTKKQTDMKLKKPNGHIFICNFVVNMAKMKVPTGSILKIWKLYEISGKMNDICGEN